MKKLLKMMRDEEGQGMVEYGLIIAAISLAVISVIWLFVDDLLNLFTGMQGKLTR